MLFRSLIRAKGDSGDSKPATIRIEANNPSASSSHNPAVLDLTSKSRDSGGTTRFCNAEIRSVGNNGLGAKLEFYTDGTSGASVLGMSLNESQNLGVGASASSTYKLYVSDDSKIDGTLEVSTPTANAHATTKLYVDNAVSAASVSNIVAGDGLAKSGNTLSINTTGPISISSDSVTIANQAIQGSKLANNTVTSTQLADDIDVTTIGVADGSVGSP